MKINTILSVSALSTVFMASLVAGQGAFDDPGHIDTCKMPGVVAYTFDDGPAQYNDELLAILASKNVKATFFVIGQMVAQYKGQLKKIRDAGHQLASHTYTHPNLDSLTADKVREEIVKTADIMEQETGVRPNYMRAPEGRCGTACQTVMKELGNVVTHWNADTNDWRYKTANVEKAMDEINNKILTSDPTKDSFIVLQHELLPWSVRDLTPRVIDDIAKKGYRFVTIEECLGHPAYSGGATPPPVTTPPTTNPTTPGTGAPGTGTPGTGAPGTGAPGTGAPGTGAPGTGAPNPSSPGTAPSPSTSAVLQPKVSTEPNSGVRVQLGAWAMGAAALASYLLL